MKEPLEIGGLSSSQKNRLSTKVITYSNVAKHNLVVLYIVSCLVAIKLDNFNLNGLSFLLKDFLGVRGRKRSCDVIYIMFM